MERRHQPGPGLREFWPGQPTAWQTCSAKVPAVTTSTFRHNATETQSSCPQRSGEALELSQGWLEAHLPPHRWIRWEIATSGHNKIEEACQEVCESLLFADNNVSHVSVARTMCHVVTKSARPIIALSSEPQCGLTLIKPHRPYSRLEGKGHERWEEAVNSIDFLHSSCKALSTINKLTGRSGRSSCLCLVSAHSITSQLVKKKAHRTGDHESTRLTDKELPDLWQVPTLEGTSISAPFRSEDLAAALWRLKPGTSPGLDSIFPGLILHARSALKSWFCGFLTSCVRQLNIPRIWKSTTSCDP